MIAVMRDISPFTDTQWHCMVDAGLDLPVPATRSALDAMSSWVYDRRYGLFCVDPGYHWAAMTTLLAFHRGFEDVFEFYTSDEVKSKPKRLQDYGDDYLMGIPGTAFLSSVGSSIITGRREHLDSAERMMFKGSRITYLEGG